MWRESEFWATVRVIGEIGHRGLSLSVFCKSNPRVLPPPGLRLCSQIMNISCRSSDTVPRKIFQGFSPIETPGLKSVTQSRSQCEALGLWTGFMMLWLMTSGEYFHSAAEGCFVSRDWWTGELLASRCCSWCSAATQELQWATAVFWQTVTTFRVCQNEGACLD